MGQARWFMPVIPVLWDTEVSGSPEVQRSRPSWPTWQNPVSIKNTKKLARCGDVHPQEAEAGELLEFRREVEIAVSCDCATALQPGQQR